MISKPIPRDFNHSERKLKATLCMVLLLCSGASP
jgi:hypothetical protein